MTDWREAAAPETLSAEWKVPLYPDSDVIRGSGNSTRTYHFKSPTHPDKPLCTYRPSCKGGGIERTIQQITPHYTQCRACARTYRGDETLTTPTAVADPALQREASGPRVVGEVATDHAQPWRDREWLTAQIADRGLTSYQVADIDGINCGDSTIRRWANKFELRMAGHLGVDDGR